MAVSRTRVSGFSKRRPCQPSIIVGLDEPSPMTKRPGSNWPSALAVAASTAGVRVNTGVTAQPMRMSPAWGATAAAAVSASGAPPSPNQASS